MEDVKTVHWNARIIHDADALRELEPSSYVFVDKHGGFRLLEFTNTHVRGVEIVVVLDFGEHEPCYDLSTIAFPIVLMCEDDFDSTGTWIEEYL